MHACIEETYYNRVYRKKFVNYFTQKGYQGGVFNFSNNFPTVTRVSKFSHCCSWDFQQKMYKKFYYTLNMLLHYLVKRKHSKMTQIFRSNDATKTWLLLLHTTFFTLYLGNFRFGAPHNYCVCWRLKNISEHDVP